MKIIDLHCDTIRRIYYDQSSRPAALRKNHFHLDIEKMRRSDYLLQNFALFVDLEETDRPFETAIEMADCYYRELEANQEYIAPARSFAEIVDNQANGKMSAILTVEEGGTIQGNLSLLRTFYRLGVRMMNLTWNYQNEIGTPNFLGADRANQRCEAGLTEFGKEAVTEMERLGMIIDVSHLSDGGFRDVVKYTTKPFAASHSNAAAICNVSRNMTDEMIRTLAERGGIMGLNFCEKFLTAQKQNPPGTMLDAMAKHVKHIVKTGGIEVCALGTDFDGIPGNTDIQDASFMPLLIDRLHQEGFTPWQLEKICYGNALRFYKDTLNKQHGTPKKKQFLYPESSDIPIPPIERI